MKRLLATQILAITFFGVPLVAVAESTDTQILHALGVIAALTAQRDHASLACAMAASPSRVQAGERFSLVWNSVGAVSPEEAQGKSVFAQGGITALSLSAPGTYKYEMDFYSASGGKVACATVVTVWQ